MKIQELFGKKQMEMPKPVGLGLKKLARGFRHAPPNKISFVNKLMHRAGEYADSEGYSELAQKYEATRRDFAKAMQDENWMGAAMAYEAYVLLSDEPAEAFLVAGESKGGPIIGAPKGSQKDARLSPGTDDPSKYMRGGEWEAYREPQGVNSNAGKIAGGRKKGTTRTKNKKTSEGTVLPPGGPGASGDLVPRHRDATTLNMVKDTNTPTRERTPMANNKAPIKQAKAKVKKSLTNTSGNTSAINESVPRLSPKEYNADYTLRDDRDTEDLGEARVRHGVIELLAVRNDFAEDFNGHIMSKMLSAIVRDADLANANLAIQLDNASDIQHKRFMERFGFRETQNGIMKRNAGSVTPPSVPTARL